MDWTAWRDEFPILERVSYLNSCSLGALSRRVRAAVDRHLDAWDARGASAWYGPWLDEVQTCRERFARLVNARPEEVALLPNVSSAFAMVTSGLGDGARDQVVLADLDFPTIAHAVHAHPRLAARFAKSTDGVHVRSEAFEEQLDERVAALATSHVHYTSGAIQDVARLARSARDVGALSILDAYQATGQLPTDVRALGCDVLITGGLKWLLGGTGISYLYVSRAAQERLEPTLAGWFGDAHQFDFDVTRFERRADARGLEMGTPSLPSVFAGAAGLDLVLEIGATRIRDRQVALVRALYDGLADRGLRLRTPAEDEARAGIVMVEVDDPAGAVRRLADEDIIVDWRPGRVRISPYFYNTEDELARVVETLASIARA